MSEVFKNFLDEFRKKNLQRSKESFHGCRDWTLLEWGGALAGEVGELLNMLKKHRRGDGELNREAVAKEIADCFTYLDRIAAELGIDIEEVSRAKFNEVSQRVDSPIRM